MKKLTLTLFIAFCSISFTNINAQTFTGSLLWEVSGNGLTHPAYIMGTHHAETLQIFDSIPHAADKFANAQRIIGEIDLTDIDKLMASMQTMVFLPDSLSYSDFLLADQVHRLDSLLINYMGAGLNQGFGRMKPAILTQTLTVALIARLKGIDLSSFKPLDMQLLENANSEGKEVKGLETAQFQFDLLFSSESYTEQSEILLCTLENYDKTVEESLMLDSLYSKGDLAGLEKMWLSEDHPCPMSEEITEAINKKRNDAWMKKLPTMIAEKPSFILVGCLHLVGEDGLLKQFHKLGYEVKAVK